MAMLARLVGAAMLGFSLPPALGNVDQLEAYLATMETMVHTLRDQLEASYAIGVRCDRTMNKCNYRNYDECMSMFDDATCTVSSSFYNDVEDCGSSCGNLVSWENSVLVMPNALVDATSSYKRTPKSTQTTEMICTGLDLEVAMKETRNDLLISKQYGDIVPNQFFGDYTGTFRAYPGRTQETCGDYDPRRRPWYVAASSGPKDVVVVIDTSGSMDNGFPTKLIDDAKAAAKQVIGRLTMADFFTVIRFSNEATNLADATFGADRGLVRATKENVDKMIAAIDAIVHNGSTNYIGAFEKVRQAMDTAATNEWTSHCNAAVLFMTDGRMNGWNENQQAYEQADLDNLDAVIDGLQIEYNPSIFTYSLGPMADSDLVQDIACKTGGVWSAILDAADLAASMSGYYKLFATGLGDNSNEDFAAWVEPYTYLNGVTVGTSVAAPAYDRSVVPHVFLGVVGVDFTVKEMESVAGTSYQDVLSTLVGRSNAVCPTIDKSTCILQALREESGWENSCPDKPQCANADKVNIVPQKCANIEDYPKNLWANTEFEDKDYLDTVCCKEGETEPSDSCSSWLDAAKAVDMMLLGSIAGGVAALLGCIGCVVCVNKKVAKALSIAKKNVDNREQEHRASNPYGAPAANNNAGFNARMAPPAYQEQQPQGLQMQRMAPPVYVANAVAVKQGNSI